jgi:hypothetical protein
MHFPVVVDSYPNFALSSATAVVDFLKLSPADHLETWNNVHKQWEMHQLCTPRRVTEDQRLLYRFIPDMSSTLEDDECPGLLDEIAKQPVVGKHTRTGESYILPITPPSPSTNGNTPYPTAPPERIATSPTVATFKPTVSTPKNYCAHVPNLKNHTKRAAAKNGVLHACNVPLQVYKWHAHGFVCLAVCTIIDYAPKVELW